MSQSDEDIDWRLTTWEGARREQLRRWLRLSVRERLEAVDRMGRAAEVLARMRRTPAQQSAESAPKPEGRLPGD